MKEADGSVTTYLCLCSGANMLQPGVSKYDLAAGRSHIEGASKQSDFVRAGYQYGFNNLLTLYGGSMVANNYYAFTLGLAGIHALVPFPSMPLSRIVNKTTAMCLTGKAIKLPTTNL